MFTTILFLYTLEMKSVRIFAFIKIIAVIIQAWEWMLEKNPENAERSEAIRFVREANEQSSWGVWGAL